MTPVRVAVVRATAFTIINDIAMAMKLAGFPQSFASGAPVLISRRVGWPRVDFPGANTAAWHYHAVSSALAGQGFGNLSATDLPRGFPAVDRAFGIVSRPVGVPAGHNLVGLPGLGGHRVLGVDGALACLAQAWGIAPTGPRQMVEALGKARECCAGMFFVMDATTAGSGPGPRVRAPVVKDLVLAGADPAALDAVAAALMGFEPRTMPVLARVKEHGLGVTDLSDIEIVGDVDASRERWDFIDPRPAGIEKLSDVLLLRTLRRAWEEMVWAPLVAKRRMDDWMRHTEWGGLATRYREACPNLPVFPTVRTDLP